MELLLSQLPAFDDVEPVEKGGQPLSLALEDFLRHFRLSDAVANQRTKGNAGTPHIAVVAAYTPFGAHRDHSRIAARKKKTFNFNRNRQEITKVFV
jgi:hypothetical protein